MQCFFKITRLFNIDPKISFPASMLEEQDLHKIWFAIEVTGCDKTISGPWSLSNNAIFVRR
jgi:hypothetical protein